MNNFIKRSFLDIESGSEFTFDVILQNKMSVILGEPASGKTSQFEHYENDNKSSCLKFDLINIDKFDYDDINDKIKTILFDSIDEALEEDFKKLSFSIKRCIKKIQQLNSNINIILSCRYFEWKEYYKDKITLEENKIKIYKIKDLKKEDINKLLSFSDVNEKEFWDWMKKNHLEGVIKNVLLVTNLIKEFDEYKIETDFIGIYKKIILNHLVIKAKDRELSKELESISSENKLKILSTLSVYLSLNLKSKIDKEDIATLDNELYKIKDLELNQRKLNLLLPTILFKTVNQEISFSHKTFKEFLTAYFIYSKNLDFETIKKIFGHKYGFYTEFEEVIVYLVGLNKELFNNIVRFDPFIFRRFPNMSDNQQKILIKSIISYTHDDYLKTKVKQLYLKDSELNKINLPNIVDTFKENIDLKNITKETYQYIVGIFNFNYSKEIKTFIIEIWNEHLENKVKLFELLQSDEYGNLNDTFENIKYCEMMNNYFLKNNLLNEDIDILKYRIFMTLYNQISFDKLLYLLKSSITNHSLSLYHNMIIKLSYNELNQLFNILKRERKIRLDSNQLTILILNILKNYQLLYQNIKLNEINDLILNTNMEYKFIGSKDDFDYYKNITLESLAIENQIIQVPFLVMRFIFYILQYTISNESNSQKRKSLLSFDTISNKLKFWIKNPNLYFSDEFHSIMRDKIKLVDLSKLPDFNTYLMGINDKNHANLKHNIKTVIFQFLSLDKINYEYIKSYWKQDIVNNFFYFKFMITTNTNEAINEFKKEIFDNKEIEIKLDIFKPDIHYDKTNIDINTRNKIKYLLTSINYIYKPKRQHNFLANVKEISDENIRFITMNYFECFNKYIYPQKVHRLDEYVQMNQAISQIFNNLAIDINRIDILEEILYQCDNQYLISTVKKTLEDLYNLKIQQRGFTNSYYKNIFDNYTLENKIIFLDDLYSSACKILDRKIIISEEDHISLEFRDLLTAKNYNISNQDEGGISPTGKSFGERDLIFKNTSGAIISIIEAIKITGFQQKRIDEHYDKLINRYDVLGNKENYMLVYYFGNDFERIWKDYKNNIDDFEEVIDDKFTKFNIKIGKSYTPRGGTVFHLIMNFVLENKK